MSKFEIIKRKNGEFQFNLKAGNGEIILTSEGYKTKDSTRRGISSVKKNSAEESRFEKLPSKDGKLYFNLKANNGKVIGVSEMYEGESGRKNGISSVMRNAPKADIVDKTME